MTQFERWFRVSPDPPDPPGGREVETFRPAPGFLSYLRLSFWVRTALLGAGALVFIVFLSYQASPLAVLLAGGIPLLLFIAWTVLDFVSLQLRFDHTWYVMTDRSLRTRRGIWTIGEGTVTFENAQNVRVRQGPLQRFFGISDVVIETAAAGVASGNQGVTLANQVVVEGVADAPRIRDRITLRMRESRSSGLGDDLRGGDGEWGPGVPGETGIAGGSRSSPWTPAHLEVLREIRTIVEGLPGGGPTEAGEGSLGHGAARRPGPPSLGGGPRAPTSTD